MFQLLKSDNELTYNERKTLLLRNNVALWDVLKSCYREGSLDSDIDQSTIEPNDFIKFFSRHKHISAVFFNGAKAEQLFKKNSLKPLKQAHQNLCFFRLPSTSPAHAALSIEQKLLQWETIKRFL